MSGANFFKRPKQPWQRRYEAMRALLVDRKPAAAVAQKYGYSVSYVHYMKHQFKNGLLDLAPPAPKEQKRLRRVTRETMDKIRDWRRRGLGAGDIAQLLDEEGVEISVRTIERILKEEGFKKLPRRTRLKIGLTGKGALVPDKARTITPAQAAGQAFESEHAGIFLFWPFLEQLRFGDIIAKSGLPGTKTISAESYALSLLALKLMGAERLSHVNDLAFDPATGLFAALNVPPKCTAVSTYSYSLDDACLGRFRREFVKNCRSAGLYDGRVVNLDFHTVPHWGEMSQLEEHWAGARGRRMKGALTLFAQDCESKLMLYTDADIRAAEMDDQAWEFLSFWKSVARGASPTLVFDSRFTSYKKLSELNEARCLFITLRRRGKELVRAADALQGWRKITVPHAKRKYPNLQAHDSHVSLRGYKGELRQVIIRGNGREQPAFLVTNDEKKTLEEIVSDYARRWRVENGIAEAVKFFHLNALSSPILIKVHFDILLTAVADTLYSMLASRLRGFEDCNAQRINRHFICGKGSVVVKDDQIVVSFPRRAHNPILRAVRWDRLPDEVSWMKGRKIRFNWQ